MEKHERPAPGEKPNRPELVAEARIDALKADNATAYARFLRKHPRLDPAERSALRQKIQADLDASIAEIRAEVTA